MNRAAQLVALLLLTLQTGCVIFPHGTLMAPPATGQVMDSGSLQPVAQASVERQIERLERSRVTVTDAQGRFVLKKDNDLRWLPFVCYAANSIQYRITAEGYHPMTTNMLGGGSFYRGQHPHDMGQILMQRAGK